MISNRFIFSYFAKIGLKSKAPEVEK